MFRERETRWVLVLLGTVTLFRLWYCTCTDLVADETYYWLWSKHLAASYYSKGPAIAWTIALGTRIFGDTTFGVRWPSVLLALGTGWQLYRLGRRLYGPRIGFFTVLMAAVVPLFAAGSVLMTIDSLSVFFWTWSANLFIDALERPTPFRWSCVGLGLGCGFLSKYTALLELLGLVLFLACSPPHRKFLFSGRMLLLLLVFLLCASPVIGWNAHHGWITARHVKEGGHLDQPFQINIFEFINFLKNQLIFIGLLFPAILIAVVSLGRTLRSWKELYLLTLFWPVFGLYALLSFHDAGNPNWTVLAYLSGMVLASTFWVEQARKSPAIRRLCYATLIIAIVHTGIAHDPSILPLHKDPLMRVRGWKEWGEQAQIYREHYQPSYLLANSYGLASELAFHLPDQPQTYIPNTGAIQNQFSFWPSYSNAPGKTVLYITDDPIDQLPGLLSKEFAHSQPVGQFERSYHGRHIETYRLWLLSN